MKYILYFFIIVAIYSCTTNHSKKSEVANVKFDHLKEITFAVISTDFLFSYPVSLVLTENELIVQDEKGHDYFFHVINRNSWELVAEFGKKGNGPGEILYPTYNPYMYDDEFRIYDYNKNLIFSYKKRDNNYVFSDNRNLTRSKIDSKSFIRQALELDSFYITMGENGIYLDKQFAIFDTELKMKGKFVDYLVLSEDNKIDEHLRKDMFNIYFLKPSPDRNYMVLGSYKMGILDIFSLENVPANIERINCLSFTPLLTQENENIYGFEDIFITDDYIYTLHNGMSADDNPLFAKNIKVFDNLGNPIIQYNVNTNLRCIAIDEKNRKAFAIAYTTDDDFFLIELSDMFLHMS